LIEKEFEKLNSIYNEIEMININKSQTYFKLYETENY
jgi:hypothetical protein